MIWCFWIISLLFSVPGETLKLSANEHVEVVMAHPTTMVLSGVDSLAFLFTPIAGIHVNTTPVFELRLDKNSPFELVGKPKFHPDENDYLAPRSPVTFSIKSKKGAAPGKQTLSGKLNYFYCSDKEGWCNRFTQPISITIDVK